MIGEPGAAREVLAHSRGRLCAEEPSPATSQKYGAGNSVIMDILV
jgi:hypothetical protein